SRHGEVITRRQILKQVWPELVVDEANLRSQIAYLRRLLGDTDGESYIENVRGRGYIFIAPVKRMVGSRVPRQRVVQHNRWRLPGRLHRLVGRQQTLDLLCNQLHTYRFITIAGAGGIGKTTAAIELGHRLASEFADEVYYVDIGSLTAPD